MDVPVEELLVAGRLHLYDEVVGKDYFRVYLKENRLVLQAGGFIGLIPINDRVAIDVRPRVPVANLDRMLELADYGPLNLKAAEQYYQLGKPPSLSILDLFAWAFVHAIREISLEGLYREYRVVESDTSFPRGRILMSQTMRRHAARGVRHRVTASWFEHSLDNGPNRCLRYACWYLAQRYQSMAPRAGTRRIVAELNQAHHLLSIARLDSGRGFLTHQLVREAGGYPLGHLAYRAAVPLACAIIRDQGITFDGRRDEVMTSALLIGLDDVFERYVRAVLQNGLAIVSPGLNVLDGNKSGSDGGRKRLFDWQGTGSPIDASPDVVVSSGPNGGYPAVLDAKYKPMRGVPERDDIEQVVAYALSYRSPSAILVYPKMDGGGPDSAVVGRIQNIVVFRHLMDLGQVDLSQSEDALTRLVAWVMAGL